MIAPEIVEQYFPKAVQWVTEMEKAILESGHRLAPAHRKDAEAIGVRQLDDVRIVALDDISLPSDPGLSQLATETGLKRRKSNNETRKRHSMTWTCKGTDALSRVISAAPTRSCPF